MAKSIAELVLENKELIVLKKEMEKRIAELVIANKELAFQNEEKYHELFENSLVPIFISDPLFSALFLQHPLQPLILLESFLNLGVAKFKSCLFED